jgi:hypothetical protein
MQTRKARELPDWGPFARPSHNLQWWSALRDTHRYQSHRVTVMHILHDGV